MVDVKTIRCFILIIALSLLLVCYSLYIIWDETNNEQIKKVKYYNSKIKYETDWDKYEKMVQKQKRVILKKKFQLYGYKFLYKVRRLFGWI